MKKLLMLSSILLSLGVFADDRIILGTFGYNTVELGPTEMNSTGFGATYYQFTEDSLYFGASYLQFTGDFEGCTINQCVTGDTTETRFRGEMGWNVYNVLTFFGVSHEESELEYMGLTQGDSATNLYGGLWLVLEDVKLRGVMYNMDDSANRSAAGGLLYTMRNEWVVGAEVELYLDQPVDGFRFSFHFGRSF